MVGSCYPGHYFKMIMAGPNLGDLFIYIYILYILISVF